MTEEGSIRDNKGKRELFLNGKWNAIVVKKAKEKTEGNIDVELKFSGMTLKGKGKFTTDKNGVIRFAYSLDQEQDYTGGGIAQPSRK